VRFPWAVVDPTRTLEWTIDSNDVVPEAGGNPNARGFNEVRLAGHQQRFQHRSERDDLELDRFRSHEAFEQSAGHVAIGGEKIDDQAALTGQGIAAGEEQRQLSASKSCR
jgi:hypothetical protein